MHAGVPVVNGEPAGSGADMREEMTGNFCWILCQYITLLYVMHWWFHSRNFQPRSL
jgi:hypothetical protein